MADSWGWAGSVGELLALEPSKILAELTTHHYSLMRQNPSGSQLTAWRDEIRDLRSTFAESRLEHELVTSWGLALEYELPREGGRRPDVILLAGERVIVMEFKGEPTLAREYLDQVDTYARDLSEYHHLSHGRDVMAVLVMTHGDKEIAQHYNVRVTNAKGLRAVIAEVAAHTDGAPQMRLEDWLQSEYAPLPSLVRAARTIFNHEPLPRIKRAYSSGVEDAVIYLSEVATKAAEDGGLHLALVAGVPGSGKTLVGLRFVYETHFGDSAAQDAVFLSGNAPLVQVLQHTLSSRGREGRVFVQDVHDFLKRYGGGSQRSPREHMWVYDEAQRAWDLDKVRDRRPDGFSEPEDFLRLGQKLGDWALMVGLIGEGQEIHVGEEAGLSQWNQAMADVENDWVVHCPSRLQGLFTAASEIHLSDLLDLDVPLRSHKAERLHDWITAVLSNHLDEAHGIADELKRSSFAPLVTRDSRAAMEYARARYEGSPEARYGLMMSSQRKWSQPFGFQDDFYLKPGPWFADGEESVYSCRRMSKAVTEFQCQGLELDFPVIGWGGDLQWSEDWVVPIGVRKRLRHPETITKNVYRVLMSRGRDGFAVFVPPRPELDGVFEALLAAGCDRLELVDL